MPRTLVLITAVALGLSTACTSTDYGPRETTGGLTGAVLGGLLGAQFGRGDGNLVGTGAGVLIGTLIGSEIGRSMDEVDRLRANEAIRAAHRADVGDTIRWNNTQSGNFGTVTVMRDGVAASGRYCREYRQTITIDGQRAVGTGIACQQPDGTWRIVG